jgi:hypothetical protein
MSYAGVTRFFTIAIISSGSRSIATRCWKARCGSGYERLSGRCAKNWVSRSYLAFCRENMSIYSWKFRRILPSATSCGASRDGASATGGGISGLAATSPPPAATSRTMSYFSIFARTYRRQPVVIQFRAGATFHIINRNLNVYRWAGPKEALVTELNEVERGSCR